MIESTVIDSPIRYSEPQPGRDPFLVVHPLDDIPEQKMGAGELPPIAMTRAVRISLFSLRAYLVITMLLLLYHVLDLDGFFRHQ